MSIVNLGNQYITWDYKHPATARDFNTVLREGIKPGIYKGGEITLLGGVEISIAPFVAYINSGVDKLVRVETRASITLSITESTPVLSITYAWSDVIENWLDFNQRASGSAPIENEIIFGEFTFSGGVITALDESEKTWGFYHADGVVRIPDGKLGINNTNPTYELDVNGDVNINGDLSITSSTKVDNLNADLLDGYHAGNATGQIPVSNGTVNTNLNADQVDGKDVQTTMTYSDDYIPTSKAVVDYVNNNVPIGTRIMYDGVDVPANYLYCDGSAVSRTTYSALFTAIGTQFGVGNGSTTFNIPDMQGLSPKGIGNATVNGRTKTGPVSLGEVQEDQMQLLEGEITAMGLNGATPPLRTGINTLSGVFSQGDSVGTTNGLAASVSTGDGSKINFTSSDSPNARTSATTAGNTRDSTIGTKFYIRYK